MCLHVDPILHLRCGPTELKVRNGTEMQDVKCMLMKIETTASNMQTTSDENITGEHKFTMQVSKYMKILSYS